MGVLRDKLSTRRRLMVSGGGVAACQPERSLMVTWRAPSKKATPSKKRRTNATVTRLIWELLCSENVRVLHRLGGWGPFYPR